MPLLIRQKLVLILMTVSGAAVVLMGAGVMAFAVVSGRVGAVRDLQGLADVTGRNCVASLVFNVREDAEEMLSALKARPTIVSARIYNAKGELFASYQRDAAPAMIGPLPPIPAKGYVFQDRCLTVYQRMQHKGDPIGVLSIEDDLSSIRETAWRNIAVLSIVMALALSLAFLLAARLQGVISRPVLTLTRTARTVSQKKDFSVRADPSGTDEIGLLTGAFNQMLANIQARDAELKAEVAERKRAEEEVRRHRDNLEALVTERTAELEKTNLRLRMEIVEHERAERRLAETLADLERSNMELEKFAHVASHDLQEPLRKMLSFGDRLKTAVGSLPNAQAEESLDRVLKSAQFMHNLINDLLAFSRVANRPGKIARVDMNEVMNEVREELDAEIERTGGRLDVEPLPEVDADRSQMRLVMFHLVQNAVKFRKPNEPPVIRVSGRVVGRETLGAPAADGRDAAVTAPAASNHAWCEIAVEDNGIGFDERYTDRIFQIFQRLHAREAYDGTGIGLAICERIAARHRGTITARSKPGQGSTFVVRIPLRSGKDGG